MWECSAKSLQCDERFEDLYLQGKTEGISFVQPQNKRVQGYLIVVFRYPKGSYKEGGGTLFTRGIVKGRATQAQIASTLETLNIRVSCPKKW